MNIEVISDGQLYELCRKLGREALLARNKFIGLLPEVNARRLYETKKFVSIFHFGAVLAGVSKEQVLRALSLSEKFEKMPDLKNLLVSGSVSINKLAKIASVANIKNQEYWAQQIQLLSCRAIEVHVRDYFLSLPQNSENSETSEDAQKLDGLFEPQNTPNFVHVNKNQARTENKSEKEHLDKKVTSIDVQMNDNSAQLIEYVPTPILSNEVKKKLNELSRKKIDINAIILDALEKREQEIAQEKEVQAEKAEQKRIEQIAIGKTPNRYRTVATNRLIAKEHGDMCSVPLCKNKAKVIHHTNRFSISLSHDSRFLAPLCDPHHQIAHSVDVKVTDIRNKRQRQ